MEQYMEHMKSLRTQMNEIEEEAARRSVDEQKQMTQIETLESDLNLVKSDTKRVNQEAEELVKAKTKIASKMEEKQRKILLLESESHTLSQTLELVQQEMTNKLVKLEEKRSYYTKISEELYHKLREQKNWLESLQQKMVASAEFDMDGKSSSHNFEDATDKLVVVGETEGISKSESSINASLEQMDENIMMRHTDLMSQLKDGKSKLHDLEGKKSALAEDNMKSKRLHEQINLQIEAAPLALRQMDLDALEEEHKALVTDKAGELEYLQSLKDQINQLKAISHAIKCKCGNDYCVELHS